MNSFSCSFCESSNHRLLFIKNGFRYWKCRNCGHIRVFPYPAQAETEAHYQEGFTENYLKDNSAWFQVLASRRLEIINQLSPERGSKLLDVGCGYGFFLGLANSAGWNTLGIENSQIESQYARQNFGVEVIESNVDLALPKMPDDFFDVVTLWHTLEHLEKPAHVLIEALRIIRKGGWLVINSPNMDSLAFRLLRQGWTWIYCPGHVQYFSLPVLTAWLVKQKANIVKKETWTGSPNLYFMVEETMLLCISKILNKLNARKLTDRLRAFVYSTFNHHFLQYHFRNLYQWTPCLDSYLLKHDLGHEFLLIAQKMNK